MRRSPLFAGRCRLTRRECGSVLLFPGIEVSILREMNLGMTIGETVGSIPTPFLTRPGLLFSKHNSGWGIGDSGQRSLANNFVLVRCETIFGRIGQELAGQEIVFGFGLIRQ